MSNTDTVIAESREGSYGSKISAIEPGGAEYIPASERHGKARDLFTTWMSPNLEFATVFVGMIAVWFFGLSVPQAIAAVVLGSLLGSISHGILGARGPLFGVPQMIISRIPFGSKGNILPSVLNSGMAALGWFAVNSVTATFALNTLAGVPLNLALVIVVGAQIALAFFGHNFIHAFHKAIFPFLLVSFALGSIFVLQNADVSVNSGGGSLGGFMIAMGAAYGYASGWNPFASDYTRYLKTDTNRRSLALWSGGGLFISCALLETLGVFAATLIAPEGATPTDVFTNPMPAIVAGMVLISIMLGSVAANSLNVYSATMSFLSLPIKISAEKRRAIATVVFGIAGGIVGYFGLKDIHTYENFLLVIAYWVAPWLGVVLTDQYLRRNNKVSGFLFDKKRNPVAGVIAMAVAIVTSIWLFSNQALYVGVIPSSYDYFGDSVFIFGFIIAAVLYAVLYKFQKSPKDSELVISK